MKKDHLEVLLEEIKGHNQAVHEAVGEMKAQVSKISGIEEIVNELKADVKFIKAAVAANNEDIQKLDTRVSALEAA